MRTATARKLQTVFYRDAVGEIQNLLIEAGLGGPNVVARVRSLLEERARLRSACEHVLDAPAFDDSLRELLRSALETSGPLGEEEETQLLTR